MTDVMGPQPKQPKKSDLFVRSLSSIVLGPPVIAAVYFGAPYSSGLIYITAIILAWEWAKLCGRGALKQSGWFLISAIAIIMALGVLEQFYVLYGLIPLLAAGMLCIARIQFRENSKAIWYLIGLVYLSTSCLALLFLRNNPVNGLDVILWILFVVWATDIGAYFAGRSIGGPKIAPKISPKKTWSGLVGGMVCAGLVSYLSTIWLTLWEPLLLIIAGGLLAVISQMGDFFESHLKRKFDAKDSSKLIPGHGGLFDRVDGLLACVLVVFVFQFF